MEETSNNVVMMGDYRPPQVDIRTSQEVDKLFGAMSKAQGEMTGAVKVANNPFYDSDYADLHSVIETSRGALLNHGLCVIQTTSFNDDGSQLCLLTTLGHTSGQWIQGKTPILCEKHTAQGMGSAITYARRYAWSAICGIAQMDDDAESAMNRETVKMNNKQVKQFVDDCRTCLSDGDAQGLVQLWSEWSPEEKVVLWAKFNSQERTAMKELEK